MSKKIELHGVGILIELNNESGTISSMHRVVEQNNDDKNYNHCMDGIESLILAHAISGVDVTNKKYIDGIKTALESCSNGVA